MSACCDGHAAQQESCTCRRKKGLHVSPRRCFLWQANFIPGLWLGCLINIRAAALGLVHNSRVSTRCRLTSTSGAGLSLLPLMSSLATDSSFILFPIFPTQCYCTVHCHVVMSSWRSPTWQLVFFRLVCLYVVCCTSQQMTGNAHSRLYQHYTLALHQVDVDTHTSCRALLPIPTCVHNIV